MLDVKEFAYLMLEEAKNTFQRDRTLAPVGYLLCKDGVVAYEFDISSKEARRGSTNAFQFDAREKEAIATITITYTWFRAFPPWEKEKPDTKMTEIPAWQREAMAAGGGRCISMDVEVPGQRTINVMVHYSMLKSGNVKFEKPRKQPMDLEGSAPSISRGTRTVSTDATKTGSTLQHAFWRVDHDDNFFPIACSAISQISKEQAFTFGGYSLQTSYLGPRLSNHFEKQMRH